MERSTSTEAPVSAIDKLPNEIWIRIFHALASDNDSLWTVYATCVKFHQCVQPALFYHLNVHITENTVTEIDPKSTRVAYHRPWVQFKDVRVLEISEGRTHEECMIRVTRSLASLLEETTSVQIIKWNTRISIEDPIIQLFMSLKRPIILEIQGGNEVLASGERIHSMHKSLPLMNIRSLDINLEHWDQQEEGVALNLFPVCSLPTLEVLTLTFRATAPGFKPGKIRVPRGSRLAPLKSLRLYNVYFTGADGYDWTKCLNGKVLQHLTLDGYLTTLMALKQLAGKVRNLKSLSVRLRNEEDQVNRPVPYEDMTRFLDDAIPTMCYMLGTFLRGVRSLEEFNGYDLPLAILDELVLYHGDTLRTFRFRDTVFRDSDRGQGSVFLGCHHLLWLSCKLPALRRLGITIVIGVTTVSTITNISWTSKMLSHISRFPNLSHLEINTPPVPDTDALAIACAFLESDSPFLKPPMSPILNPVTPDLAEDIFQFIARRKANYACLAGNDSWRSFDCLEIINREWEPMIEGVPQAFWGLGSLTVFTCRRKIGVPREVDVSVTSTVGITLTEVHRYNQSLALTPVWDRRGVYTVNDSNGV